MIKLKTGKSKKGNDYQYIEVKIGEYEGRLYPSKAECAYIKGIIEDKAHSDFRDDLDDGFEE